MLEGARKWILETATSQIFNNPIKQNENVANSATTEILLWWHIRHKNYFTITHSPLRHIGGAMEYNVGMLSLSVRHSRPRGPTAWERFLGTGQWDTSQKLGVFAECCKFLKQGLGRTPGKFEFRAFWNLKIASKHCSMAMKLYESPKVTQGMLSIRYHLAYPTTISHAKA